MFETGKTRLLDRQCIVGRIFRLAGSRRPGQGPLGCRVIPGNDAEYSAVSGAIRRIGRKSDDRTLDRIALRNSPDKYSPVPLRTRRVRSRILIFRSRSAVQNALSRSSSARHVRC